MFEQFELKVTVYSLCASVMLSIVTIVCVLGRG